MESATIRPLELIERMNLLLKIAFAFGAPQVRRSRPSIADSCTPMEVRNPNAIRFSFSDLPGNLFLKTDWFSPRLKLFDVPDSIGCILPTYFPDRRKGART